MSSREWVSAPLLLQHSFSERSGRNPSGAGNRNPDRRSSYTLIALTLSTLLAAGGAQAQTAAENAQEIIRQQERERALRQQMEVTPDVRLESAKPEREAQTLSHDESPCFVIKTIALRGEASYSFRWVLAQANRTAQGQDDSALSRCLGTQGINLVMRRIQDAIVGRGYVTTRVLAEPQDLASGVLTLTLVPGRVRDVRFTDDSSARATQWNAVPIRRGDLLNLRDIEQALENFKRVPTAEADIQVVPAEGADARPGESDLVVTWKQALPLRLNLSLDDAGSKSTGKYQAGVTLSYDHWLTLNDLLYFSANHDLGGGESGARGTYGYTAHYSVPYGYWLLGMTASQNRYYQSVAGANQTYRYSGESENSEVELSRLVYRDVSRKTTVSLKGWTRRSRNYIDDTEVLVQRRQMSGWDLGVAHQEFLGASTVNALLNYRQGTGAFGAMAAPEEAFGEGTARPKIYTAHVSLNMPFQFIGQRLRMNSLWRAQWNDTPLIAQDRFAIGGRYTVRGFDGENQLSAEHGWLVRNDLGWSLGDALPELYMGADYGKVGGPSAQYLIGTRLAGAVVGIRGAISSVAYDLFVGKPLSKPDGFKTASSVAGFNLNWSF